MTLVLGIGNILLICAIAFLLAKRWNALASKLFWAALVVHLFAGACLGLIYKYHYSTNDTWVMFELATRLAHYARTDFYVFFKLLFDFGNEIQLPNLFVDDFRMIFFLKIMSFFCLITGDNYWICTAYFSIIAFTGSWFLHRKVTHYFSNASVASAIAFLFFPSIVFWSSGLIKETLALASVYFLAGIFLQLFFESKYKLLFLFLALIATVLVWALKYYWAGVFFIAAISAYATNYLQARFQFSKSWIVLVYTLLFMICGVSASILHPNFYLNRFLTVVAANHDAFVSLSSDANLIHFNHLEPSISSFVLNSPWALFSGIFRPFVGEGQGWFGLIASVENLIILILFLSFWWNFRKPSLSPIYTLALAAISYCVVLCIFLALSSPNLGTLSRYRVGFLPFLIFILCYRNGLIELVLKKFSGSK